MNIVGMMSPPLLPFIEFVVYVMVILLTGMWAVDRLSRKIIRVFLARNASLPLPERVKIFEHRRGRFVVARMLSATTVFIAFLLIYAFMPDFNENTALQVMLLWLLPISTMLLTYFMKRMVRALDHQIAAVKQEQQRGTGQME